VTAQSATLEKAKANGSDFGLRYFALSGKLKLQDTNEKTQHTEYKRE
jgi:hypothetical protein